MIKDPIRAASSNAQRELFDQFGALANQFSTNDVVGAAANIIVNALRQSQSTRKEAEKAFDEIFGQIKSLLVGHYDMLGRKRGIFPYDQRIEMPLSDFRPKQ